MVASRRSGPGRRVATGSGGLSWAWSSSGIEHEVAVAHGLVGDGELEDPIEDQSAAARAPAVEPEDELVEVAGQVGVVDGALVGASSHRLAREAIRWTPAVSASRPAAGWRWWT